MKNKSKYIIYLITIIIFTFLLIKYIEVLKLNNKKEYRYVINNVLSDDYGFLYTEAVHIKGVNDVYNENVIGYVKDKPLISVREISSFDGIKEDLEKSLISGRLPKSDNEVLVEQSMLDDEKENKLNINKFIDNNGYLNLNIGSFKCDNYYNDSTKCDGIKVTTTSSVRYKIVGIYEGKVKAIYKLSSNEDLKGKINAILNVDENVDLKLLKDLSSKYSEDFKDNKNEEYLNNLDIFYTNSSLINNKLFKNTSLAIFIITTLLITIFIAELIYINLNNIKNRRIIYILCSVLNITFTIYIGINIYNYKSVLPKQFIKEKTLIVEDNVNDAYNRIKSIDGINNINLIGKTFTIETVEDNSDTIRNMYEYLDNAKTDYVFLKGVKLENHINEKNLLTSKTKLEDLEKIFITFCIFNIAFLILLIFDSVKLKNRKYKNKKIS